MREYIEKENRELKYRKGSRKWVHKVWERRQKRTTEVGEMR